MWRCLLTFLAGLVLVGCTVAAQPTGPPGDGSSAVARNDDPSALREDPERSVPAGPSGTGPTGSTAGRVPVRSAAGIPSAVQRGSVPSRLVIDALQADVPVDGVGIAPDGQMEIPPDAARAGWYRFGHGVAAAEGTTVIAAHSGSFITDLGPLRNLIDLEPGDPVSVETTDGTAVHYVVEAAELIPKSSIDFREHFRRAGEHRLILITCDGTWQEDRQSYSDNTIVTARLR